MHSPKTIISFLFRFNIYKLQCPCPLPLETVRLLRCNFLFLIRISYFVLAIECTRPPVVPNATRTGQSHAFEAVVSYECKQGTRFEDGTTSKSITCLDSGSWNDIVSECARTYVTDIYTLIERFMICYNAHVDKCFCTRCVGFDG